jgi:hypothetical protein
LSFPGSQRTSLAAAMGLGLVLRLAVLLNAPAIELDGIGYATMADQFVRGLFGQALKSVFPPVYPLFVALFHLAIPDVELPGRLVSLVFGVLLIYGSFVFAKRLLKNDDKAIWVAFLVALHPYLVRYSGQVLSESLAAFLFTSTVFLFYVGWQEERRWCVVTSGLCLTLAYLTRPEYVVFYVPFVLCLLAKRRFHDSLLFLLPFLVLGSLYICFLRIQTGVWMVSGKARLLPFVPFRAFFGNVPLVAYEFFIAIFPLFFVLALPGSGRVQKPYRNLVLLLVLFHIVSLSFVSHATRRYSVEFIPLSLIFVVEGIGIVIGYLKRFVGVRTAFCAMATLIVCATVFQSFAPPHHDRALHKKAGLFLLSHDPGSVVAARLPLVAFYEKGAPVNLLDEMSREKDLAHFKSVVAERKIKYLVIDRETERELPFLKDYLPGRLPVCVENGPRGAFVRVYRL